MSVPLGDDSSRRRGDGPQPTAHQIRMASIRAEATGESLDQVLSVFMGGGRHGTDHEPQPVSETESGPAPASAPDPVPASDDAARLADVIPLSRARGTR
ncbi:hypothetical protein [Streptomyces nanshensis]|nr:hypothetical protein [Streptomyces nanshensis]